jgi:hypothetical protein
MALSKAPLKGSKASTFDYDKPKSFKNTQGVESGAYCPGNPPLKEAYGYVKPEAIEIGESSKAHTSPNPDLSPAYGMKPPLRFAGPAGNGGGAIVDCKDCM